MKHLILTIMIAIPMPLAAQTVDLSTLPEGYNFTSSAPEGDTIVKYLGPDGDLFKFSFSTPDTRAEGETGIVWTNRASQTVIYEDSEGQTLFSPNDCAPGVGVCHYEVELPDGEIYKFMRSAFRIGDVEIGREYIIDESGDEILYSQSCVTFDEWGFWVDAVRYDFEGVISWDRRSQSSHDPGDVSSYQQLRKLCSFSSDKST